MPEAHSRRLRRFLPSLLLPPLIVAPVAVLSDSTTLTAALLLLEPLWFALGLYLVLIRLTSRRPLEALGLTSGLVLALSIIHWPMGWVSMPPTDASWSGQVARCSRQMGAPTGSVRVLHWDLAGQAPEQDMGPALSKLRPDILVLSSLPDPALLLWFQEELGGEIQHHQALRGGLGLWVRGAFQYCGREIDAWHLGAASSDPDTPDPGFAILTFPRVQGSGLFPLVAFESGGALLNPLPARLLASQIAGAVGVTGESTIVVGQMGVPPSYRRVGELLRGASLQDHGAPPTWPGSFGRLPGLTMSRLGRVLGGPVWVPELAQTIATRTTHQPLLIQFGPGVRVSPAGRL